MNGPTIEELRAEMATIKEGSEIEKMRAALAKLWARKPAPAEPAADLAAEPDDA